MTSPRDHITALLYRYAELIDAGDLDGAARLFARSTWRTAGQDIVLRGADEVAAVYHATVALYDGSPCTKHVITNAIVDVAADETTASARSYFTVFQARPELPLQPIISGRYHDQFARDDGSWYFTDRLILIDLLGDLSRHLKWSPL